MNIIQAKKDDIQKALKLTRSCASDMIEKGIFQWNEHYPSKEVFEKDILLSQMWKLEENGDLIGVIVLTEIEDAEYNNVKWLTENRRNLYIHRLAVHPDHQGKGYAQRLMDFAEAYAKKNGYLSIRLDTFSQNKRNQRFYELRNYQKLEEIYFPKQSTYPFYCYEKIIHV